MTIHTHFNVDLDAVCSVWAVRRFFSGMQDAEVQFHPANWNGDGMNKEDYAVDIRAGGRGIKGDEGENGVVHSCFKYLMGKVAPVEAYKAMANVIRFVDAHDTFGSATKVLLPMETTDDVRKVFEGTGLNAVLRAFQSKRPRDDDYAVEMMGTILDGMLEIGLSRQRAEEEARNAYIVPSGKVAVLRNAKEYATNGLLFEQGVRVIVYEDGCNLGIIRSGDENLRMDHPDLQKIVEDAGEADEWFAHPAGFLYCRGSRKAPAKTLSKVEPEILALAVSRLLDAESVQ